MTPKTSTLENTRTVDEKNRTTNLEKTISATPSTDENTKSWLERGLEMMGEAMLINQFGNPW